MATLTKSKTVTYEEWLRMPEVTDAIEEVVNGEIRIMPACSTPGMARSRCSHVVKKAAWAARLWYAGDDRLT